MSLDVGAIVTGKITGITNFGAFVELDGGITGLVHISEVSKGYTTDINEHLKRGQEVRVKVLSVNGDKISLSVKKAIVEQPPKVETRPMDIDWSRKDGATTFEDMMSRFKQDSDERMQDIKRNTESKRNGYRRTGSVY